MVPFTQEFPNAEMLYFGYFGVDVFSVALIFNFFLTFSSIGFMYNTYGYILQYKNKTRGTEHRFSASD